MSNNHDNSLKYHFRMATDEDMQGMLEIYAPIVENTHTSFEYEVPTLEDFTRRVTDYARRLPWLVCRLEDKVVGYAYAVQLRGRISYTWSVELSVYVAPEFFGKGVGRALYKCLMRVLKLQGARNFYAVIALPNDISEKFHLNLGFKKIGVFNEVGFKDRWIDIAWYLIQEDNSEPPGELLSMDELMKRPEYEQLLADAAKSLT